MKRPAIDLSLCTKCLACVEYCPEVFRLNDAGYVEVIELAAYPEGDVNAMIAYCPEDCIYWQ